MLLTGTDHCNSSLSENIYFKKVIHSIFNILENLQETQNMKVAF